MNFITQHYEENYRTYIHPYTQICIAPKLWKGMWGTGTGWLHSKNRLE